MPRWLRTCASATILLAAFLISGCAQPASPPAETVQLEAPVVQPEPCPAIETTSLQRYQELSRLYEAEKSRSATLATELAGQQVARQKAEADCETLRRQLEPLVAKAAELALLKSKADEAQKSALEMESSLREARRQLLEERLAGVKRDETIVALKIERAKDARKFADRSLQYPAEKPPQEAAPEKPASQNAAASGGHTVVNP